MLMMMLMMLMRLMLLLLMIVITTQVRPKREQQQRQRQQHRYLSADDAGDRDLRLRAYRATLRLTEVVCVYNMCVLARVYVCVFVCVALAKILSHMSSSG